MTAPYYSDAHVTLHHGDCVQVMAEMPDASVDAIVTDPPYGLEFMGRTWDRFTGERIDPAFMHWLAGFIDGEGCFSVHKKPQSTYDCQFSISLRADDRPILERIHRTLRMGTLSTPTAHRTGDDNPKARFSVSSKRDCIRLRDLLRAFPLRAKKAKDFEVWSDALDAWLAHKTGEWDDMALLRDELMQGRAYTDEGVRVDPFQMWCWRWARECLRVLKPGGHMLAFGGSRTWHRLAAGIEDAGFEMRDSIAWLYGSGFPKSLDVSKAIDSRAKVNDETKRRIALVAEVIRAHREAKGMERSDVSLAVVGTPSGACWNWENQQLPSVEMWPEIKRVLDIPDTFDGLIKGDRALFIAAERAVIGQRTTGIGTGRGSVAYIGDSENRDVTAPATDAAAQWQGWGTALKPSHEPIVVARKPLRGTVAANVLEYGTGAINVDGCRIEGDNPSIARRRGATSHLDGGRPGAAAEHNAAGRVVSRTSPERFAQPRAGELLGRWPANVVLDDDAAAALDAQSGESVSPPIGSVARTTGSDTIGTFSHRGRPASPNGHGDSGGASRFFYTPKADTAERPTHNGISHPTVKPLDLMRWLVRLVTPPGGVVLEPFAGSGTTVEACILEGFRCIAIEREADYLPLITQRIHRRRDPVEYLTAAGEDLGLFGELA